MISVLEHKSSGRLFYFLILGGGEGMAKIGYKERILIEQMCKDGYGVTRIANQIGCKRDTIYKEFLRTGMNKENYNAKEAQLWK